MNGFVEKRSVINIKYRERKKRNASAPNFEEKIKIAIKKLEEEPRITNSKVKKMSTNSILKIRLYHLIFNKIKSDNN